MLPNLEFIAHNQPVAETLVVSFPVIMQNELVHSFAQRAFTEEDHSERFVRSIKESCLDMDLY